MALLSQAKKSEFGTVYFWGLDSSRTLYDTPTMVDVSIVIENPSTFFFDGPTFGIREATVSELKNHVLVLEQWLYIQPFFFNFPPSLGQ